MATMLQKVKIAKKNIVKKLRKIVVKNAKAATAAKSKAASHEKVVKKAAIRIKKILKK